MGGAYCRLSLNAYSTLTCHLSRLRRSRLKMTDYLHLCTWSYTSYGSPIICAASLDHSNGLSDYQVWTGHQASSGQLNMFHPGRDEEKLQKITGVLAMRKDRRSSVSGILRRCSSRKNWSWTGPGNKHPASVHSNPLM